MKKFICSNAIWLTSLLAMIGLVAALACDSLSTTQSCVLLWFFFITLHGWEEYRIPGGFTQMMFDNLGVNIADPNSGHLVVQALTLFWTAMVIVFPSAPALALAPLLVGILELLSHLWAIWAFKRGRIYNPGLFTAIVLFPVSVYGIVCISSQLAVPSVIIGVLYLVLSFAAGVVIVLRVNGITVGDWLKTAQKQLDKKG